MESTFTFYYCKDCGMLLFKWNKRVSRHGLSYREFSVKGFEEETDFDERETDVWEVECPDCGTELDIEECVAIPLDLAQQIKTLLSEDAFGLPLKEKDYKKFRRKNFNPKNAKEILFESLL